MAFDGPVRDAAVEARDVCHRWHSPAPAVSGLARLTGMAVDKLWWGAGASLRLAPFADGPLHVGPAPLAAPPPAPDGPQDGAADTPMGVEVPGERTVGGPTLGTAVALNDAGMGALPVPDGPRALSVPGPGVLIHGAHQAGRGGGLAPRPRAHENSPRCDEKTCGSVPTDVSTGLLLSPSLPDTKTPGPTPRTTYWHSSGSPEMEIPATSLSHTPVKYPEPKQPYLQNV